MNRKSKLLTLISLALVVFLLASLLTLPGCAAIFGVTPIFEDEAEAIDASLSLALDKKADALDTLASDYESSGEVLKDQDGNDINMVDYIAMLKSYAQILRDLTYEPYALAIMDDLYASKYIGVYRSVLSLIPKMVDCLAEGFYLDMITTKAMATDALIVCYIYALEDFYAGYVDAQTAQEEEDMPTSYVGIGVSVTPRDDGYIDIVSVTRNSPAEAAGILPGDILIAVDGIDVSGVDYNQVVLLVRGEEGTDITLTFSRDGAPYTVTVTRAIVDNITVEYKLLSSDTGKTGYLRISQFSPTTFSEFVTAIEALEAVGAEEYIFDVRNNPGGNAEAVIAILEYILPDDISHPIIRLERKDRAESFYSVEQYLLSKEQSDEMIASYAAAKNHTIDARIAVICNEFTTSAGELFTSALKDFGYAEIFGTTTYGKGLGQTSYRVTDYYAYEAMGYEYATYFDMAYFVIPSFYYSPPVSDNYHEIGVVPHHTVELSEEAKGYYLSMLPEKLDDQLQAALAFVQSDEPFTPAPTDEVPPSVTDKDPAQGGDSSTGKAEKDTSVPLFVFLGIFAGAAVAVVIYIVLDYRRRANHVRPPYAPPQDRDEDH